MSDSRCDCSANCVSSVFYGDRGLVLLKLSEAIDYLHKKGIKGKYQNKENEKLRIQYFKALAYTCNVYNNLKRDIDIEELTKKYEDMILEIQKLKEDG